MWIFYLKFLFMVEGRKLYKPLLIRVLCLNRTYCIYLCCSSKVKQKGTDGAKPRRGTAAVWPIHSAYSCFPSAVCLSCPCEMGRPSPRLGGRPAREDTCLTLARRVRAPCLPAFTMQALPPSPPRQPLPFDWSCCFSLWPWATQHHPLLAVPQSPP